VEFLRAGREQRYALVIHDARPVDKIDSMWTSARRAATIGIFTLLLIAFLYFGRSLLLPILAAAVIGTTLAPLVKFAARHRVSPWITALVIVSLIAGMVGLAATLLAGPIREWIARAPEIGAAVKANLYVLDRPLAALRELQNSFVPSEAAAIKVDAAQPSVVVPVVAYLTPAAGQSLVFLGTLIFYLAGQLQLRAHVVSLFANRDAKLRFLKIAKDIEHNLTGYLAVVTIVNLALGLIVGVAAWLLGFPNPIVFGILATILNYVPYIGPAVMVIVLFGVGLVTFSSLGQALIAPVCLVGLTTLEGHFITPTIVGRRLTLNPLLVFLALVFWTWLWGPIGAFLAIPLSIAGLVTFNHLFPTDDVTLPE